MKNKPKIGLCLVLVFPFLLVGTCLVGEAAPQLTGKPGPRAAAKRFNCSPAPCVLPPTQASEGGNPVIDTPIATNPLNQKQLLLGGVDGNCPIPSVLGFHFSRDGGSSWRRKCMASIINKQVYWPSGEPSVGFDRNGAVYIAGAYVNSGFENNGLIAFQKSMDGVHWSKPAAALRRTGDTPPFETALAVDTTKGSPRVNSLYVSGVMSPEQGDKNQVWVSHSTDGGAMWTEVPVDAVQLEPEEDHWTRVAVGKNGTVYNTWMRCASPCPTINFMFSKSIDGGDTWSTPQRIATVRIPPNGQLPNTEGDRVYNYPAIAADNSDGPYSGRLYVAMYTWTGTYLRVEVICSTDDGTTWSEPVLLAPKSDTHDQFFPAISVSPTGKVGVSWLDRRNDPANIDYQAFAAVSTDGGLTYPNTQLTKAFSNPNTNGGNRWMGDYTGNAWAGDTFIAAWMDSSNGIDMQAEVGGIRLR